MKTKHLSLVTQEHSVTTTVRSNVYSPYGPVNQGLITSLAQGTLRARQEVQLMALLNSLESLVANLNYKSCTVLDTLVIATQGARVALLSTPIDADGTDLLH